MNKQDIKSFNRFKDIYTKEAAAYDSTRYVTNYGKLQLRGIYHALDTQLNINNGTKILDVATGTGVASLYMANKGGKVIALDLTEGMLRQAKGKADDAKLNNITFNVGSAFELPYKDHSFDIVTSVKFFHLIPNSLRNEVVSEMLRVLKPGGNLLLEFKNGLYGGVLRLFRKRDGYYLWPCSRKFLSNVKIEHVCGSYLPAQRRIPQDSFVHDVIETLGHYFFLRGFCDKLYIKCSKPADT